MAMPTLLDIAIQNGSDAVVGLIDETSKAHPEIAKGFARTIKGLTYKTLVRIGLPTVAFRNANAGALVSKGIYQNRLYETFIFNPRWECDTAVADTHEDGANALIAMEALGILEAGMQTLASQFYYGTANDPLGFAGLMSVYDTANMEVNANGTTANTGTSVWAVKFGPKDIAWLYGNNGALVMSEVQRQRVLDTNGLPYTAYVQEMLARPGLQCGNIRNFGRIKNITSDAGCGLTDKLLGKLLSKFQVGIRPDMFLMNRAALEQLRESRTATNITGAPAPTPIAFEDIPIYPTDAITSTEAIT